jgi:hypothetical protein
MIRLPHHCVGKAESLFVANLKPFFDSIDAKAKSTDVRSQISFQGVSSTGQRNTF